ncbi:regulator of G-protein signaling protein-like [Lampetra fluviatilis]
MQNGECVSLSLLCYRDVMQDGRTSLAALLEDEIFVEFFNIFLNLPVFGQRAFYLPGERTWAFQPKLPSHLELNAAGLQQWLQQERLPLFVRSELSVEMALCKEMLAAPLAYTADPTEVKAERSRLHSCVGNPRGMAHLRTHLRHTQGGEMLEFWAAVERLRRAEEAEGSRGPRYHGLLRALAARHLREPSSVLRSCVPGPSGTAPRDRARLLRAAQGEALSQLRGYWVPRLLRHERWRREWRASLAPGSVDGDGDGGDDAATPGSRGHDDRGSSSTAADLPPSCVHHHHDRHHDRHHGHHYQHQSCKDLGNYRAYDYDRPNSPKGLRDDARSPARDGGCRFSWGEAMRTSDAARGSKRHGSNPWRTGGPRRWPDPSPAVREIGREILRPEMGGQPPETEALRSALACDHFAGGPLLAFLEARGHGEPPRLLFWQEAEGFARLATRDPGSDPSLHELLSQAAERVWRSGLACGVTLTRGQVGVASSPPPPPATLPHTLGPALAGEASVVSPPRRLLSSLLGATPGAAVSLRLADAQRRMGQELGPALAEFVDRDIALFVKTAATVKCDPCTPREVTEAADPSPEDEWRWRASEAEGLAWTFSGPVSEEPDAGSWEGDPWHRTGRAEGAAELPPREGDDGGWAWSFEETVRRCPSLAVRMLSDNFQLYYSKWSATEEDARGTASASPSPMQLARRLLPRVLQHRGRLLRRPLAPPRSLREALGDAGHEPFVALLARGRGADAAVGFWREAERLRLARGLHEVRATTAFVHARYFHRGLDPAALLQCKAPIMLEIQAAQVVTPAMIATAQTHVYRVMEATWFKIYLDSFPERSSTAAQPGAIPKKSVARAALRQLVRSVAGLLAALREPGTRRDLAAFLGAQLRREEALQRATTGGTTARSALPRAGGRHPPLAGGAPRETTSRTDSRSAPVSRTSTTPASEQLLTTRRTVNDQKIVVNFLMEDFAFFQEVERFKALVDSSAEAAAAGMGTVMDAAWLREKAAVVSRLFLDSEDLPACRVNVSQHPREQVLEAVRLGHVERGLFFPAVVHLLPSLIYYWRKFCSEKALRTYLGLAPWERRGRPQGGHEEGLPHPGRLVICSADFEFTTLRFSLSKGMQLLQPVKRGKSRRALSPQQLPDLHVTHKPHIYRGAQPSM